jgi:hypothetical protein
MSIEALPSLATALAAFQAKLPDVIKAQTATVQMKTGGTYKYNYAGLPAVSSVVLPLLGAVGLSFSAKPTFNEAGKFVLAYRLLHSSGDEDRGEYPLPQSGTAQEIGSAITYARRYALCSVVGVAPDEDDDGAAASAKPMRVAEKHEEWDPIEQEVLFNAWQAEIEDAGSMDTLTDVGRRMKRTRELSPASKDRLAQIGAGRRVELEQAVSA